MVLSAAVDGWSLKEVIEVRFLDAKRKFVFKTAFDDRVEVSILRVIKTRKVR